MPHDAQANGATPQGDTSKVTDYLRQAAAAVEAGNPVLGVHLYLSAFGFASSDNPVACEDAISGLKRAWSVAFNMRERSLAEYIFEKMEPYLSADELDHCNNQLQELALDRLEELGVPREAIEGVANMFGGLPGLDGLGGMGSLGGARIMHVEKLPGTFGTNASAVALEMPTNLEGGASLFDGMMQSLESQGFDMARFDQMEDGAVVDVVDTVASALPDDASDTVEVVLPAESGEKASPANAANGVKVPAAALRTAEEEIAAEMAKPQPKTSLVPQAGSDSMTRVTEKLDYDCIAGYAQAIDNMAAMGIGVQDDPDFQALVALLNESHGLDRMPAADTLLFRSPAREDASRFVQATLGELKLPVLRMSMEENMQGMPVLCVMASAQQAPKMNAARNNFTAPAVLVIEDLDLWLVPQMEQQQEGIEGLLASQLSRGAREAVNLIRNAVDNPDVYVLATLSALGEVDPFFCDLLTPFALIEIENPNDAERFDVWASLVQEHPSLAYIDVDQVVRYSANLSRNDMYCAVREAIEESYKESLASREYAPVKPENLFEKMSAYQPLESDEYQLLEDSVADMLRSELDCSVDEFLGLVPPSFEAELDALQPVEKVVEANADTGTDDAPASEI